MNILTITDKPPISSKSPGNPRFFEFTKRLSKKATIDLVLISNRKFESEEKNIYSKIYSEEAETLKEKLSGRIFKWLWFLPSFYLSLNNQSKRKSAKKLISGICRNQHYDLVYVDGLSPFQFVPSELYSKTHLDFCDSISKLKFREAGQQKKLYKKLAFLHEAVSIYIREFLAIFNVKSVSFISESETEVYPFVFSKNNFATKLLILNQGLDNDLFKYTEPKTDSKQILFFGALDYFPNDDAAMWFGTEIFSTLKKHFPSLEFHIVGKSPSKDITQLGSRDGIFVHANVPEMQPYLENAKIIVVPLRVGAGVKNKILIAALSGRPIVSTSVGLEGLDDSLIRGIYKADNVEEFVAQIRLILSEDNQSLKVKLETLSKKVLEVYSWENSAEQIYNSVR